MLKNEPSVHRRETTQSVRIDPFIRPFHIFAFVIAGFPVLWLGAFYNYVMMARLHLGYWPQYNRPDPKRLGWSIPHDLLWLGLAYCPYVWLVALCVVLFARFRSDAFPVWYAVVILWLSMALYFLFLSYDPGNFFDWFAD